ncbi:hypothetical protein COEREDRAFT_84665 [Coemansia reversa NRRL 1564]|uniref:U1-type domain-containing protein n=1 Tax=Coemansia reversa (strain ATCC 12441 / NRRL 1564) TaxID=763665 RepID=A0A2G5BK52_COERN|nr:hypothetical protein COEREDRAFT_84665 [Coemansia reversa NRRL 1564]|eukprot:PIA19371.1 hypothetical protein COEREDRAFT_84665 [Coemansia reversa NRRL 1564]
MGTHKQILSRQQHESGTKHKDSVQKYLRQIGKDSEAKQRAEDQLNDQFAKIEEAAAQSYKKDIGTSTEKISSVEKVHGSRDQSLIENATTKSQKAAEQETVAEEQQDTQTQPDRPADVGVVGAWQVIEDTDLSCSEDEHSAKGNPKSMTAEVGDTNIDLNSEPQNTAALRGAELLDEEDQHPSTRLDEFHIKEKTIESKTDPLDTNISETKAMFKKRRAPANRSTRKQRKV